MNGTVLPFRQAGEAPTTTLEFNPQTEMPWLGVLIYQTCINGLRRDYAIDKEARQITCSLLQHTGQTPPHLQLRKFLDADRNLRYQVLHEGCPVQLDENGRDMSPVFRTALDKMFELSGLPPGLYAPARRAGAKSGPCVNRS